MILPVGVRGSFTEKVTKALVLQQGKGVPQEGKLEKGIPEREPVGHWPC